MIIDKLFFKQTFTLTFASMKARYRNTIAGFIWVVINPLIMFGAQSIAFKKFLRLELPNYYLFLLGNLLPWIFIINSIQMCASIFEERSSLLKSFKIQPLVILSAQLLDNFINFVFAFSVMLIAMLFLFDVNYIGLAFLPLAFLALVMGGLMLSIIAATMQVFFRDTKFIVQFISSVIFFLTPVFYPIEFVPPQYRDLISWNIFYILITPVRICIYNFEMQNFIMSMYKACGVTAVLIIFQIIYWKRKRNDFYLYL